MAPTDVGGSGGWSRTRWLGLGNGRMGPQPFLGPNQFFFNFAISHSKDFFLSLTRFSHLNLQCIFFVSYSVIYETYIVTFVSYSVIFGSSHVSFEIYLRMDLVFFLKIW
jgi:hypothetical protein